MAKRGFFIVIEGIDSSGKATQAELLKNRLEKSGHARKKYRDWLWRMGYDELGILRPDLVLFLDVPPKISCLTGGKLDSPAAIHRRIWDKLSPLLPRHPNMVHRPPSILELAGTFTPKRNRGVSVLKAREYMERHYKRI